MNVVAAKEVKRRGVIALTEHLKHGPVHIIKNNHPACVVLSEKEYKKLKNLQSQKKNLHSLSCYANRQLANYLVNKLTIRSKKSAKAGTINETIFRLMHHYLLA